MACPERRLIVNADDFGRSAAINEAVAQAHCSGMLTTASLMVNEPAATGAAAFARAHPQLGVGLHLTLVCGRSALTPDQAPGLVSPPGRFRDDAFSAGWQYFFRPALRAALRREIEAQFARFEATGRPLDHVNGHLNIHLHPTVLRLLCEPASGRPPRALRLTRDPFWLNARLARGRWAYRLSHAVIFTLLSAGARPRLQQHQTRQTDAVFGLLQNGHVDAGYLCRLLPQRPAGDAELYCRPSLTDFRHGLEALLSPEVRQTVRRANLQLIRYQDL